MLQCDMAIVAAKELPPVSPERLELPLMSLESQTSGPFTQIDPFLPLILVMLWAAYIKYPVDYESANQRCVVRITMIFTAVTPVKTSSLGKLSDSLNHLIVSIRHQGTDIQYSCYPDNVHYVDTIARRPGLGVG